MKLFDVVRLKYDRPHENLTAGMEGTIVEVFSVPDEAFMVEICDDQGRGIAFPRSGARSWKW